MKNKKIVFSKFVKREDARLYVLAYKPCKVPNNALVTTIHCGAALHNYFFGIPDDYGENISKYNNIFCDLTGTYFIWKNHETNFKYIGQMQYSKLLKFKPDTDFDKIFENYNGIAVPFYTLKNGARCTLREQWCTYHPQEWLDTIEEIIAEKYPEYIQPWQEYVNEGTVLYYGAGMVLRTADFERYCELLFGICDEFIKRYGGTPEVVFENLKARFASGEYINHFWGRNENYCCFVFGFAAERIATMFLKNLGNIMETEYQLMNHV